jgi:hypothetical protein
MNLGIQHSARPGDFKKPNSSKLPKEVVAMAKQMGLDMSTMGKEAQEMWDKLNDLSAKVRRISMSTLHTFTHATRSR